MGSRRRQRRGPCAICAHRDQSTTLNTRTELSKLDDAHRSSRSPVLLRVYFHRIRVIAPT